MSLRCNRLDNDGVIASLLAGGMAGIAAWTTAMPFDVIKSLMQVMIDEPLRIVSCSLGSVLA